MFSRFASALVVAFHEFDESDIVFKTTKGTQQFPSFRNEFLLSVCVRWSQGLVEFFDCCFHCICDDFSRSCERHFIQFSNVPHVQ